MTHYDDAFRSALSPDDVKLYDALGRMQNPVQAAFAILTGDDRGFAIGAWMIGFGLFAAAIYAGVQFADAGTTRAMIGWAAAAVGALFALGMLKIWFFMEMQRNALMRELKRVEIQISTVLARRS